MLGSGAAIAAPPALRNLDRRGLQIGGSTVLTLDGNNLLPHPKLVLSAPIVKQVVRPGATATRVAIEITLDKNAMPGLYNVWLANDNGLSAARVVALDHLPQRAWVEKEAVVPVALEGSLAGSKKLTTSFHGKAGQALLCEVEAQRLGEKVRPVLHLYDAQNRQIAWSLPSLTLGGDTRLSATLPADGLYTVAVHDLQYAAPQSTIRLRLGNWPCVDAVFPAAVRRGQAATVTLIGNGSEQRIPVQASGETSALPLPWTNPATAGGLRPWVQVSDLPEYVEKEGATTQDAGTAPVALNGRLVKTGEVDRFRLQVQPGTKLRFEVFADRLGTPMDAVLKLERANGTLLAQADDSPGSADPVLEFTVPKDVKTLVAAIEDVHGRGRPSFVYRVVVRLVGASPEPDFRVFVTDAEMNVPIGGTRQVEVAIDRRGYNGPVKLAFDKLPPGIQVQGTDVPAGANGALLVLVGPASRAGPEGAARLAAPTQVVTALRGSSTDPKVPLARLAEVRAHPLRNRQPWLASELAVCLTPKETLPFAVKWGNLPADTRLVQGSTLKIPLTCSLPKDQGGVRIYLLTSHRPPLVNGNPDQNQALRKDQGPFLELPVAKPQGDFGIRIPATLAAVPQDLAFRADLLSKDRTRVIAQVFTPVRRFNVLNPLVVKPATPLVQAALDARTGAVVKLTGKIERLAGFKGDVTVSLKGVPPGIGVPNVAVKAAQTDYKLDLRFPPSFKPGEIDKLQVFATGRFAPNSPVLNRSEGATVRVKLLPPKPR